MVFFFLKGGADAADSLDGLGAAHGTGEAMLGDSSPLVGEEDLDGLDADLFDFDAELIEGDFSKAPVADRMLEF